MDDAESPSDLTRRRALTLAAGATLSAWIPLYASDSDFWDTKPPADWSKDEIQRLLTRSPWSKEVTAQFSSSEGGRSLCGGSWPRIGIGMGGPRISSGRGGRGRMEGAPQFTGTVRWESARPIVEALKTRLPDAFANRYVIGVSGFPMMSGHRRSLQAEGNPSSSSQDTLDDLKAFTFLKPKDKEPVQPGIVQPQQRSDSSVLLFGFLEELLDLDLDDKEVAFSTRLERLTLRTKFNLKEMMYHGKLAV